MKFYFKSSQKLGRRILAVQKMNWTTNKVSRVAQALVERAMSSEESCTEEQENGTKKVVGYTTIKLPWESERFAKAKRDLDNKYRAGLSQRSKDRVIPRKSSTEKVSSRPMPEGFPAWATS